MNRTDRLLAIVLELQRMGRQRAEDLAATFEVTKRTIYRDVQALMEIGVPVVSMTGYGYVLAEGYFLPPLRFSTDEAFMLILGSGFMAQNFDAQYRLAAQAARQKIETILSDVLRADIDELQDSIGFLKASPADDPAEMRYLPLLRRAIIEKKTVRMRYRKRLEPDGQDALSQRDVDPYGLKRQGEAWYLVAFCHQAQEMRSFRLSRIQHVTLTSENFVRPRSFNAAARQRSDPDQRRLTVRALFDPEAADWLPEARSFYIVEEVAMEDGLLVTLKARHERDVLSWLLSWGSHITVIEPDSLRQRIAEECRRMLASYERTPDPLLT